MVVIDSCLNGVFPSHAIASRIQSWHVLALLFSLVAHLLLILWIDTHVTRVSKQLERALSAPMQIHLVMTESSTAIPGMKSSTLEDRGPSIVNTQPPDSLPIKLAPELPSQADEILLPPIPYYYRPKELTVKPIVSTNIPENLGFSLPDGDTGSAILRVRINEQGEVDQVMVDESSFSGIGQKIMLEVFRKMKFEPGKLADKPVKSELKIVVTAEEIVPVPFVPVPDIQ